MINGGNQTLQGAVEKWDASPTLYFNYTRFICSDSDTVMSAFTVKCTAVLVQSGRVNDYQLRLGRQRQVWFIPLADERGVCR